MRFQVVGTFRVTGTLNYCSHVIASFKTRDAADRRMAKEQSKPFERTGYSSYAVIEIAKGDAK